MTDSSELNPGIAGMAIVWGLAAFFIMWLAFVDQTGAHPVGFMTFWLVASFISIPVNCFLADVPLGGLLMGGKFAGMFMFSVVYIPLFPLFTACIVFYRVFKFMVRQML
ncbi:MAG: hypothetical protein QNJ15_00360 [Erythrobacter sp.]|nr:hypothetical protein [Erythrobacter sp.]